MKECSKNKQDHNFGAFFAGILLGGIAGTIAGLLLSPKSGIEIRNQISENVNDTQSKAWQVLGSTKINIQQGIHSTSKNIEDTVNRVVNAFNAGTNAAKGTIQEENIAKLEKNNISDKISDIKSEDS